MEQEQQEVMSSQQPSAVFEGLRLLVSRDPKVSHHANQFPYGNLARADRIFWAPKCETVTRIGAELTELVIFNHENGPGEHDLSKTSEVPSLAGHPEKMGSLKGLRTPGNFPASSTADARPR